MPYSPKSVFALAAGDRKNAHKKKLTSKRWVQKVANV